MVIYEAQRGMALKFYRSEGMKMTLEETINFIKGGSYSELEDIDLVGIVDFLEELQLSRKALEIACEWNELNLGYLNEEECLQKAREQE